MLSLPKDVPAFLSDRQMDLQQISQIVSLYLYDRSQYDSWLSENNL